MPRCLAAWKITQCVLFKNKSDMSALALKHLAIKPYALTLADCLPYSGSATTNLQSRNRSEIPIFLLCLVYQIPTRLPL